MCQDQLGSLPVLPFWARPQSLKWLGLCFGERALGGAGAPALRCGLAGEGRTLYGGREG